MDDIWKQVLAEIEIEVSKPVFLGFFKLTNLVSNVNSVATINAQTPMAAKYIEERYYSLIKRVLDRKTGQNISLVFISSGISPKSTHQPAGPLFFQDLAKTRARPARIRADYTFDSLAVSASNQLAYTAAQTVASSPGDKYNPLYLYGTVGVGKTHLMNAIANKVFADNENCKILYMTTEEFTNEVVEAIMEKSTTELRKKFRNVNLLLLDDIQFLSGKDKVQEELFHTFNALADRGSQIVFSSDRPPHEIRKIEARLASRFEGGLLVDIEPPDLELRCAILVIKSRKYGMNLSLAAATAIAEKIEDARALEGFLLKLASTNYAGDIGPDSVTPLLEKNKATKVLFRPDIIINAICSYYNIKITQLKGERRDSYLVNPRHICMFLLKEDAGLSYVEIGNLLGGRDHSTVMHGVEKVRKSSADSDRIRKEILFIKQKISEQFS